MKDVVPLKKNTLRLLLLGVAGVASLSALIWLLVNRYKMNGTTTTTTTATTKMMMMILRESERGRECNWGPPSSKVSRAAGTLE